MGSESLKFLELSSDWQSLLDLTFPDPIVPLTQQPAGFVERQDDSQCSDLLSARSSSSSPLSKVAVQESTKADTNGDSFYLSERIRDKSCCDKDSEEYRKRRERNNIAVRRSREKAKQKILAKEDELKFLMSDNSRLKRRCEVLEEEVKVLRSVHEAFSSSLHPVWIEADRRLKKLRDCESVLRQEGFESSRSRDKSTGS